MTKKTRKNSTKKKKKNSQARGGSLQVRLLLLGLPDRVRLRRQALCLASGAVLDGENDLHRAPPGPVGFFIFSFVFLEFFFLFYFFFLFFPTTKKKKKNVQNSSKKKKQKKIGNTRAPTSARNPRPTASSPSPTPWRTAGPRARPWPSTPRSPGAASPPLATRSWRASRARGATPPAGSSST